VQVLVILVIFEVIFEELKLRQNISRLYYNFDFNTPVMELLTGNKTKVC
jgi:hypothetical protein